jgi:uncharacterized protein (TIGR02246 family)
MKRIARLTLIFAFVPILTLAQEPAVQEQQRSSEQTIREILTAQTKAWNQGDLKQFMGTYWKSENLTFSSGGKTTRGWNATLANYKKSYPTREKMGRLNFDGLEINLVEPSTALVLGNWHLKMSDDSTADGNFSLVIKQMDGKWKIIHDHSSTLKKPENENQKTNSDD